MSKFLPTYFAINEQGVRMVVALVGELGLVSFPFNVNSEQKGSFAS